jgi:hypothetical protein
MVGVRPFWFLFGGCCEGRDRLELNSHLKIEN